MPIRPSPRRVSSSKSSAPLTAPPRPSLAYVCANITMLWVVVIGLGVALWTFVFLMLFRIERLENELAINETETPTTESAQFEAPATTPSSTIESTTSVESVPAAPVIHSSLWKAVASPDEKKIAGFDITTKGKMGLAVQVQGEERIRHIVIFDPRIESTGNGTTLADEITMKWISNSKISYDYLRKENGTWVKVTDTAVLGF